MELGYASEEAHFRHGYSRDLAVASAIERGVWFWPPVRASAQTLSGALERWADEVAVADEQISRARPRSALLTGATEGELSSLAAFSGLDGVIKRLSALDEPTEATASVAWLPMLLLPGLALGKVASLAIPSSATLPTACCPRLEAAASTSPTLCPWPVRQASFWWRPILTTTVNS